MNAPLKTPLLEQQAAAGQGETRISLLGTTALLFEALGALELNKQKRIWAMAELVRLWPSVREVVPCLNNMLVVYRDAPRDLAAIEQSLLDLWAHGHANSIEGKLFDVPVRYGGACRAGLAQVSEHSGLSPQDVVRLHSERIYTVYGLGSHPGHCYLADLDPRLATPRRKVPLLDNPGGSVSIGGSQTSFSVSNGPTGWWAIGRTELTLFDPAASPPALMQPGDRVRFLVSELVL